MQITKLSFWKKSLPGLLVATALAIAASRVGEYIAWLGGAGLAIL